MWRHRRRNLEGTMKKNDTTIRDILKEGERQESERLKTVPRWFLAHLVHMEKSKRLQELDRLYEQRQLTR